MTLRSFVVYLTLLLPAGARAGSLEAAWEAEVYPLVEHHCFDCHGDGIDEGELALDDYGSIADMQADRERWKRIRIHLEQNLMPPLDEEQPSADDRHKILDWIEAAVFPVDPDNPDPGRVTLRRLNRTEYENTLRDLLGVPVKVMELLPPDDSGYGFDNIGDVLTLSPAHLERFLETARIALDQATHPDPMPYPTRTILGRDVKGSGRVHGEGHYLTTNGNLTGPVEFPESGRYRILIRAGGTMGGNEGPRMILRRQEQDLESWEVTAPVESPAEHEFEISVDAAGKQTLSLVFDNDFYDPDNPDPNNRDRNLFIHSVSIIGPIGGPRPAKPESHRKIYIKRLSNESDEAWATRVFHRFARRAFRRPSEPGEVERYLHFIRLAKEDGRSLEDGIRHGLEAMLVSPAFLFREEPQPEPDNPDQIHPINEHALAARLSYFLWSTMPDRQLMELAEKGQLRSQLDQEVERMLDSPRSKRFIANFVGQWLQLRDLQTARPSKRAFPKFDPSLRSDMARETSMLFAHLIRKDRPLTELLDADYTFLNERLARHYGIKGVKGKEFRRISLNDNPRRGILGHGSFLLVTSHPLRTSPVLRGKYVLENLLGIGPPPPPPNVPQLKPPTQQGKGLSLRQQMEKHREDPGCASCHTLMDPIGFGLQNFDADASWRTTENGKPVDTSGELEHGRKFQGADGLRDLLLKHHHRDFLRSSASKMLTYALGRGVDWYDKPAIDRIIQETSEADSGTRAMIKAVVDSVPFQYRRGES